MYMVLPGKPEFTDEADRRSLGIIIFGEISSGILMSILVLTTEFHGLITLAEGFSPFVAAGILSCALIARDGYQRKKDEKNVRGQTMNFEKANELSTVDIMIVTNKIEDKPSEKIEIIKPNLTKDAVNQVTKNIARMFPESNLSLTSQNGEVDYAGKLSLL